MKRNRSSLIALAALAMVLIPTVAGARQDRSPASPPLRVCVTTPDLGSLVREVGGDRVDLTVFAKGTEDPHFLEAKPSFIKEASEADLFVVVGLELEVGWAPAILKNARNARIQPGAPGYLDASKAITPLEVPSGDIDRSMGDVHSAGNPHYLTDPLNGVRVAALIADRLSSMRPDDRDGFHARYEDFRRRVYEAMVGPTLASKYDVEKLCLLFEHGRLEEFLKGQGDAQALAGWFGAISGHHGEAAVADHNLWPYFSKRFGLSIVGYLEPKPGIAPTTKHLQEVIGLMKQKQVRIILTAPYFDARHAAFVARATGARIVALAHQVGAEPGADSYIQMCEYNIRELSEAMKP